MARQVQLSKQHVLRQVGCCAMQSTMDVSRIESWIKVLFFTLSLLLTQPAAQAMDLLQVYQAALQQDPTVAAARAAALAEAERLPMAQSQYYPNLSANFSETRNNLTSTTPNFLGKETTNQSNYPSRTKSVTLRQPLYRPLIAAQLDQARAQVRDAQNVLVSEEQNLAVRVASAYFEALLAQDQLELMQTQHQTLTTQLDAAQKMFASGAGIRTDVDEAMARIDMNRAQTLEARQRVNYTLQQLQALIDEPVTTIAPLQPERLQLQAPEPAQLQPWIDRANANNPQLRSLQARLESAKFEVDKSRSGHKPTVDAIAQWSDSESESVTSLNSRYRNNTFGVQVNIPLFAGGYVNAGVRQAIANASRAEKTLEAARRDIAVRVHQELRTITESIAKIEALQQALQSSEQMLISTQKSYKAGSRTLLDIANAQQQKMVVLRDLAQARYVYLISRVRLLAVVGRTDRDAIQKINNVLLTPITTKLEM